MDCRDVVARYVRLDGGLSSVAFSWHNTKTCLDAEVSIVGGFERILLSPSAALGLLKWLQENEALLKELEGVEEKPLPISPYTGEPYDPEWGWGIR